MLKDLRHLAYLGFATTSLAGAVVAVAMTAMAADDSKNKDQDNNRNAPVSLLSVIKVPGNPVTSADISWADPVTERYYFADRSNFGVEVIDAEKDVWVGRVKGMAGPLPSGGGTSTTNGPGPNGVVVTPQKRLWAGDGKDRKSTRLNSSHGYISYAVFCLKKKKKKYIILSRTKKKITKNKRNK